MKAQAAWEKEQIEKWNKIFSDLQEYIYREGFIFVYDYSTIESRLTREENIVFQVNPGEKIVPNRKAWLLTKTIADEWSTIYTNNTKIDPKLRTVIPSWCKKVKQKVIRYNSSTKKCTLSLQSSFSLIAGLYDNTGYCIAQNGAGTLYLADIDLSNIASQTMFFEKSKYSAFSIGWIKLSDIPDNSELNVNPLEGIISKDGSRFKSELPIMSVDEYNEWVKNQ